MDSHDIVLRAVGRRVTPWRNGLGTTTDVASEPTGSTAEGFDWRISIATIDTDCAFSRFDGVDRVLVPLSPGGLRLTIEGRVVDVGRHEALVFAGEHAVACTGVTERGYDLNLMVRRSFGRGSVTIVGVNGPTDVGAGEHEDVVAFALAGDLAVARGGGHDAPIRLAEHDAVRVRRGEAARVTGRGSIAIARIRFAPDAHDPGGAGGRDGLDDQGGTGGTGGPVVLVVRVV
jgi:environmental stress-induced protein Ves